MNYYRIYGDFIRDRMGKPPPGGYTELHHIYPRCLGGSDEPNNIIQLTPEDHFRAHLLLAKAYPKVRGLQLAPLLLSGLDINLTVTRTRASQVAYGIARRLHAAAINGDKNWNFDPTIYHFKHPRLGELYITIHGFCKQTGIRNSGQFGRLMTGKIKSISGWYLPELNPNGVVGYESSSRAISERKRDKGIYVWQHQGGHSFKGTKHEFELSTGVSRVMANALITGYCQVTDGWFYPLMNPDGVGGMRKGERHPKADLEIHTFSHDDGRTFIGTRMEMQKAFGPFGRSLDCIVNGSKNSVKGWMLADRRQHGSSNRFLGQGVLHRFRHDDLGEFIGTQHEFSQMASCSPGNTCMLIKGSQKSAKGWRYVEQTDAPRRFTR